MKFQSNINEVLFISEITPTNKYMFNQDLKTGLSVIWNIGQPALLKVDGKEIIIQKNCVAFLTEFHRIEDLQFERLKVLQFNKSFYCVEKHDSEVPSFSQPIEENAIKYELDASLGMTRVEVLCNTCDAHLGHVFKYGPKPSGLRYCINSASIKHIQL